MDFAVGVRESQETNANQERRLILLQIVVRQEVNCQPSQENHRNARGKLPMPSTASSDWSDRSADRSGRWIVV